MFMCDHTLLRCVQREQAADVVFCRLALTDVSCNQKGIHFHQKRVWR